MQIDELIRQRAEELRLAYEQEAPRALPQSPIRKARMKRSGVGVMAGAALAVLLVFGPMVFLLSPERPTSTTPIVAPDGSVASPLYEQTGDRGLGSIMDSGENLISMGYDGVLSSADGGESWQLVGGVPDGEEAVTSAAANGDVLLVIAAHGGAGGGLYRSTDLGATWELQKLPTSPRAVAYTGGRFVVAGTGSADAGVGVHVWKSVDGQTWESEQVADVGVELIYIESVEAMDDGLVLLARTGDDFATRLLAFEQSGGGAWSHVDLTPIIQNQAGISIEPSNENLIGAAIIDGELSAWWTFDPATGDPAEKQTVVTRLTADGEWEATHLPGIAPETVTPTSNGLLVGTSHPGEQTPYIEPRFTAIVASADGVNWEEIGRFQGIALGQLEEIGPNLFLASGKEVDQEEPGKVPSSGIWKIELPND
jgi:hypothetical protein